MMLFIIEDDQGNVTVTNEFDTAKKSGEQVLDRNDFKSFDDAERAAEIANRANDGETYVGTDGGNGLYPRYDVVRVPKVGDKVSIGFNGDSYPCGVIVSIGTGVRMTIRTDEGSKYNRFRKTGSWRQRGNGWSLMQGHHNDRNPSF